MGQGTSRLRLDEILVKEGLVTQDQVKEALMRQKAHGGKFGSQLLYHRYIDETGLVKALSKQFNCEGVVLSNLKIPEPVIAFIPSRVAIARKIIPFDYDVENNVLKIACEDPADESLLKELGFVARGKKVKLYVAAELALNTAIARHYLGRDTSLDDNLLLEIPDIATETGKLAVPPEYDYTAQDETDGLFKGTIMLVTDEEYSGPLMQSLLERDNYKVVMTDSADDAIDMLGDEKYHTVFIKDTVAGDYIDLIDRLRKISPKTKVRYYESTSSLFLETDVISAEGELLLENLDLFTSLLATKDKLVTNHGGIVGDYVDKLCQRIGLPVKDRLAIVNAAFVHDLAKFYYQNDRTQDFRETIKLTIKLLQSLNYSPITIETLRSMYIDLKGKYTKRLPIEVLGGNILTIVDLFCDHISINERLSLDKFDAIKKKFRDLTGKLFLAEVVEAFIVMIKEEILQYHSRPGAAQVMVLDGQNNETYAIELRLKNEDFRTMSVNSVDSFVELYSRSRPDMIVLVPDGDVSEVIALVERLVTNGVDFGKTPAYLLAPSSISSRLTPVLEKGIEDVIAVDLNLDMLIAKLRKIQLQLNSKVKAQSAAGEQSSGTKGRLADMNLIDLIQALGPGRRTVKITLSPANTNKGTLTLYLNQGQIIFAQLNNLTGAKAVYEAITWTDGKWTVEPLGLEQLPPPNNDQPNESILMEGCRLLDEKTQAGELL